MTPRAGYIDCVLKHALNHIHYKDIRIPDQWRQFIMDNHKLGPTKVHIHCCVELVITSVALTQIGGLLLYDTRLHHSMTYAHFYHLKIEPEHLSLKN